MNVYEIITERIIKSLESNKVPWQREWSQAGNSPSNVISGKAYRGINSILLWEASTFYGSPWFLTVKQALSLSGRVKREEWSNYSVVTFWKVTEVRTQDDVEVDPDSPVEETKKRFSLFYFKVYNINQCENLELPKRCREIEKKNIESLPEPQKVFDNYINRTSIPVELGNPSYSPGSDKIRLPERNSFVSPESYYTTAFHEAVHSTGHSSRLNRFVSDKSSYFGSETYSKEELVAELGAAFLSSQTKIDNQPVFNNSVSYIKNWLKALKNDHKMVVFASSKAQRAVDYLLDRKDVQDGPI